MYKAMLLNRKIGRGSGKGEEYVQEIEEFLANHEEVAVHEECADT